MHVQKGRRERHTHMQREIKKKKCVFINEGSVLMFLCPTSCMRLNYDKEYCIASWVVNRFRIYLSRWWKRMAETRGWRVRKLRTTVQLVQYTRSPPWCRSLAEIIRCNHLILVAHNSDARRQRRRPLACVSTQDREQTRKLPGQNPICASAVCIPSLLVPTLQWSRRSGRIGSCRNHNGHHPDSSHSHAGDEQQGALPARL